MKKTDFNIIDGGLSAPLNSMQKQFSSAYVTNTRLMGVLAVYSCWNLTFADESSSKAQSGLHQFFYIDCEEAGLETYKGFRGEFGPDVELAQQNLVGGLGADKIPISEMELRWLLLHWKKYNEKHSLPMPSGYEEYSFIFEQDFILTKADADAIILKTFDNLISDYQVVNYFLMRCFGRDYEAARYLTDAPDCNILSGKNNSGLSENNCGISPMHKTASAESERRGIPLKNDFPIDIYDCYINATFCRNAIHTDTKYGDGSVSYICDSLIEMDGKYDTVISKVIVRELKIIGFEHCDRFSVSSAEAAMMLRKTEYVDVYEVVLDEKELEENIGEFIVGLNTIMTKHSNGRLFMAFKSNNDHVNSPVFMLSNDVWGTYFLTDFGQLIVMAHNQQDLSRLNMKLSSCPLGAYLLPTAKYEFIEPVLFEFINSGFEDFEDFLGIGED